jgi:hypothetical protein
MLYNCLFFCLDFVLVLHFKLPTIFENINYDMLIFVLLWFIIIANFLLTFSSIGVGLYGVCIQNKNNEKKINCK